MHGKPVCYEELFEFVNYSKAKGVLREMAMAAAKAGADNGK